MQTSWGSTATTSQPRSARALESRPLPAPALYTGPMSGGERGYLVKKEQLGVCVGRHQIPLSPLKFKKTGNPGFGLELPFEFLVGIVKHASVTHKGAS